MRLLIVHYHLRPGGIRRIIETATPFWLRQCAGQIEEVVLAAGEANDQDWNTEFKRSLQPVPCKIEVFSSWKYVVEQGVSAHQIRNEIESTLEKLFGNQEHWVVWVHNPGVGRNLILVDQLVQFTKARRHTVLIFHHHDFWFDNRWQRWPEMRLGGFSTLLKVAQTIFPSGPNICHLAINRGDVRILKRRFRSRAQWLPNLMDRGRAPAVDDCKEAKKWITEKIGVTGVPYWILPCRLLRRKNIAEAILLMRWLRPEAQLITTGAISSGQEQSYGEMLRKAIRQHDWPVSLSILDSAEKRKPAVSSLIAISEVVMLTSIQEGFGLPYLEAVVANRPLVAREIPSVCSDLRELGFHFPHNYQDILVDTRLFDLGAEWKNQKQIFMQWKRRLPKSCATLLETPDWLEGSKVAFSRLTLSAQLEVLRQPVELSWKLCGPLNPFLFSWRDQAAKGQLKIPTGEKEAFERLAGDSYGMHLARMMCRRRESGGSFSGAEVQHLFIRKALSNENLFPLLWSDKT